MARYYRRRRIYRKKNKWNIEQKPSQTASSAWVTSSNTDSFKYQVLIPVVPAISQEGVRKVKNISISAAMSNKGSTTGTTGPIYWALIYAPEGTIINELHYQGDLYQPSNFVINSGIIDNDNIDYHI